MAWKLPLGCCLACRRTMQGGGEVKSWLCTVLLTPNPSFPVSHFHEHPASQQPKFSAGMSLPLLGGRKTQCQRLPPLLGPPPFPPAWPIVPARCLAWSAGAVVAKESQIQGDRLGSHVPTERDQQNLSCVTSQPGACHSLGKKGNDQEGSLCSAKINVSYFCLAVALYSNYINYS